MRPQEVADRVEIAALLAAYNIAGDQGRPHELAEVFAPDGTLRTRNGVSTGREAIARQIGARTEAPTSDGPNRRMEFVRHNLTTSHIAFDGDDAARGRTYFIVYSEIGPDHAGVYVDRYRKLDGAWWIAERDVRIDWVAEGGHSAVTRPAARQPGPDHLAGG